MKTIELQNNIYKTILFSIKSAYLNIILINSILPPPSLI